MSTVSTNETYGFYVSTDQCALSNPVVASVLQQLSTGLTHFRAQPTGKPHKLINSVRQDRPVCCSNSVYCSVSVMCGVIDTGNPNVETPKAHECSLLLGCFALQTPRSVLGTGNTVSTRPPNGCAGCRKGCWFSTGACCLNLLRVSA